MNSVILRTATSLLLAVLLLFSVFLLLRGHDLPGGGFIGGLLAASAVALYAIAFGHPAAVRLLRVPPQALIGWGLALGVGAGLVAGLLGEPYLTGQRFAVTLAGVEWKLSSTLVFDVGVYLVVVGVVLTMLFALEER